MFSIVNIPTGVFVVSLVEPTPTYHGELDGVQRVAGKNLRVESSVDHGCLESLG